MGKGATKQRAKKKQQKQQQRKKKLARREGRGAPAQGFRAHDKPVDLLQGWDPITQGIVGLARRRRVPFIEAAHFAEVAQRTGHPGVASLWTPSRVAALSEDELLTKLAALGVTTDRERFLAATASDLSALPHAGEPWVRELPAGTTVLDSDFVLLAASDLWRRWRPERPSREMLLLRHLDGWDADGDDRPADAIDAWLDFGEMIWKALPDARRMSDIDAAVNEPGRKEGAFYFDAFAELLLTLALDAAHDEDHARADRTIAYAREILRRLPDSDAGHLEFLEGSVADLLEANLRHDEALALVRGMMERNPHRGAGYVMLAQALTADDPSVEDLEEAIATLNRAYEATDAKEWDLKNRIAVLEEDLALMKG